MNPNDNYILEIKDKYDHTILMRGVLDIELLALYKKKAEDRGFNTYIRKVDNTEKLDRFLDSFTV
jgi:hypothetical protein